jgi:hypothetical protein
VRKAQKFWHLAASGVILLPEADAEMQTFGARK